MDLRRYGQLRYYYSHRVRIFGQFPCAREFDNFFKDVWRVQRLRVIQALDQRLNLVEIGLFPQEFRFCKVQRERELGRPQEVEDVPEKCSISVDEIIPL